ncbi:MAG: DNA polymerase III subunit beta [Candidatus Levybacteria bacterium RIFCSPLOWO2_01_FULL_39_24]|nr:MAG: DNA polymerase III subunit beta [Candidatus Levybacteria bacterium RIFCSPHIGHO2_01_FULL_40_16]OGH45885.1 MAG: DNA polymerase III subunit beta [Candidatus Levybacteria bacterium RIFCSPLOWO2_01_FULL_39_24]
MKTSLILDRLQKKILFVNHAISARSQLPTLLNFLIEAKEGGVTISATDLEIGIIVSVPAKTERKGSLMVPAKTFVELIGTISSGKINLETTPEGLMLTGDREKAVFQTTPTDEFPKLYEDRGKSIMVLKKETLEKDFSRIVFAASPDSERPALSGVLIKESNEGFLLVATDGYRLSLKKNALQSAKKEKGEGEVSMLVPARVIRELIQMEKDEESEDVKVFASKEENQIIFSQSDTMLIGRLIEAEFPNYEKIIPTDFSTKAVFERDSLQKAIKAGYVFARQTAGIIKLAIQKNKISVSANAPSVGKNQIEVDAKTTGEENEIAFNARYLLDFLANSISETISFEMTGPLNPGVFRETDDSSFMHLIMPIRVQEAA